MQGCGSAAQRRPDMIPVVPVPLHLSRCQPHFPPENPGNTLQIADLQRVQGRALHLSRFRSNSLIFGSLQALENRDPLHPSRQSVASLSQNRCITSDQALHLSQKMPFSRAHSDTYTCPLYSPVVTYKSLLDVRSKEGEKQKSGGASGQGFPWRQLVNRRETFRRAGSDARPI